MFYRIVLFVIISAFIGHSLFAQSPTNDTIPALPPKSEATIDKEEDGNNGWLRDTTFQKKKHSPRKATLYSTFLPGLGQVYNRQYYKVPILAGAGVAMAILITSNNFDYQQAKKDYETRTFNSQIIGYGGKKFNLDSLGGKYDDYDPNNPANIPGSGRRTFSEDQLRLIRDNYRRDRDFYIIISGLIYALNIVDAAVFAHLREFEVSEKVSMKINPDIRFFKGTTSPFTGITLSFNFIQNKKPLL